MNWWMIIGQVIQLDEQQILCIRQWRELSWTSTIESIWWIFSKNLQWGTKVCAILYICILKPANITVGKAKAKVNAFAKISNEAFSPINLNNIVYTPIHEQLDEQIKEMLLYELWKESKAIFNYLSFLGSE